MTALTWRAAFAVWALGFAGGAWAADDPALVAVEACRARLDARTDVGLDRIEKRCPGLMKTLEAAPWAGLLPNGMRERRDDVSAESLRELVELVRRVNQASAERDDTIEEVERLAKHPLFTPSNPNRLRSVEVVFGMNQWVFNHSTGRGYRFLADLILAADKLNPQVAARLMPPFGRWRRFDEKRQALMREQLERILATPGLSKDVYEQASKSLA